jgi:hypothetical protein
MSGSDLRDQLRAIDPAAGTRPYTAERQARILAVITDPHSAAAARAHESRVRPSGVPGGRSRRATVWRRAAFSVAATVAITGGAIVATHGGGGRSPSPIPIPVPIPGTFAPGLVAAELDHLAATVPAQPGLGRRYQYTKTRSRNLGQLDDFRTWNIETLEQWQGTTCNDQMIDASAPAQFPTERDRQRALAWARSNPRAGLSFGATTETWRGKDLISLDAVPCGTMGTFEHPNPDYAASLPTQPRAFLDRVARDAPAQNGDPDRVTTLADHVVSMLELPWLTDAQRSAGLRALALAGGEYTVAGHETIAGVRGVVLVSPVYQGLRTEMVIGASAPGLLRQTETIIDPVEAAAHVSKCRGLPKGTKLYDRQVVQVAVVPDFQRPHSAR